MYRALLLALALAALIPKPASGQDASATSDTTLVREAFDDYENRFRYTVLVDPFALYSRTFGFGIRAYVTAYNLLWAGSRSRALGRLYQRRALFSLTLRTHDPAKKDVYGLLKAEYETTSAYRYYGVGQSTLFDNLIWVNRDRGELHARVGFEFLQDHLTIQPSAAYLWNKATENEEESDSAFVNLDRRSQEALLYALGFAVPGVGEPDNVHQGVSYGVDMVLDYRDRMAYPLSGFIVRGAWNRYQSLTDQDVVFDRFDASAHAFLRISGSHVLALRGMLQSIQERGNDPIPFYLYPKLDFNTLGGYRNQRHIDQDLVNISLEYRWPFINLVDLYQVSGFAQAGLGGVYLDVWKDFKFDVTFKRDLEEGSNALRPGFGLGLRVSGLEQQVDYIQWMLGFGPEGFTLYAFSFVIEIGDIQ